MNISTKIQQLEAERDRLTQAIAVLRGVFTVTTGERRQLQHSSVERKRVRGKRKRQRPLRSEPVIGAAKVLQFMPRRQGVLVETSQSGPLPRLQTDVLAAHGDSARRQLQQRFEECSKTRNQNCNYEPKGL